MRIRGLPLSAAMRLLLTPGSARLPDRAQVFICVADHFEPKWHGASREVQRARMARWMNGYPEAVRGLCDSVGRPPQHTFFYPADEYEPEYLDQLADLCHRAIPDSDWRGYGDVEVH